MARGAHKVNPYGFRVGVNKNWKSIWYADKSEYADKVLNDEKIRKAINKRLKKAGVASIVIKRLINKVVIQVQVARPGVVIGRGGTGITNLQKELKRIVNQEVDVKIFEVKNPEIIAKLVAEAVALQCEKRVNPKLAAQRAVQAAKETNLIEGITIWVGGRIKGADIARVEKADWGVVPRHTLRKDIDYAFAKAQVPGAGIHGIKVWICKGETKRYKID